MKQFFALFVLALLSCTALQAQEKEKGFPPMFSEQNGYITDMCLLYHGRYNAAVTYDKECMKSYVYYTDKKGKKEFLYDGFLILEIVSSNGSSFENSEKNANQKEWQWLMNRQFEEGYGISAINDILEDLSKENINPERKRKVVISIPMPYYSDNVWGEVNGEKLVMNNDDHRIKAAKWYINEAEKRFKEKNYKHIELAGFYWVFEKNIDAGNVMPVVSTYLDSKDYYFYWIPYFWSKGAKEWKEWGFDMAYYQPNYFFVKSTKRGVPPTRIDEACDFARTNGLAMEFEFDGNMLKDTLYQTKFKHYVDHFTKNGVFDNVPVAYYEGGGYWNKIAISNDPNIIPLYRNLSEIIIKRQKKADKMWKKIQKNR